MPGMLGEIARQLGTVWYWIPGREFYARSLPPDPPSPSSSYCWPIGANRSKWFHRFKENSGPTGMGCFGYRRKNGVRGHAGTDLKGRYKDPVVAVTDGQIVSFYDFYNGVYALVVDHGNFVINYGEVDRDSLTQLGLSAKHTRYDKQKGGFVSGTGSTVKAGQQIGFVGRMRSGSSMLHFEIYQAGTEYNKRWTNWPTGYPSGLLNAEKFLLKLSGSRVVKKEVKIATAVCR